MKKDILKEFVADNRNSFDEYEPSLDVLNKIRTQLELESSVVEPKAKVVSLRYWWAAAAVLVLVVGSVVFFRQNKTTESPIASTDGVKKNNSNIVAPKQKAPSTVVPTQQMATTIERKNSTQHSTRKSTPSILEKMESSTDKDSSVQLLASNTIVENDWRKDLESTNSSSVRLAAVLASGKKDDLSIDDLHTLANTMNNDESSNVRLAALDVLNKQQNRSEVKDLVLQSIAKQDDPIVQMELLSTLSPEEASKVKNQLVDITQNPMSIEAVRNQAYAALLRSKSNF